MMNLKIQLQIYLDYVGWTAAELSRRSKVSQQVISLWLKGGEPKKMTQVKQVADALCTSVDHLCFGEGLEVKAANGLALMGDDWLTGLFEVKIRRVSKVKDSQ